MKGYKEDIISVERDFDVLENPGKKSVRVVRDVKLQQVW